MTAKILYVTKRARPDLETTVSFLMRRVSNSNAGDWGKLLRALGWLKRTKSGIRIIGAQSLTDVYTWIDAAYAVHNNELAGNAPFRPFSNNTYVTF